MSGGEASAPADATPPDFCARRSSLEVFTVCFRRFPLFALSLFLALLLVPSRAFAWDFQAKGVLYSTDLDGSRVGYVVSAYNQFDAACYALGKDPNTISSLVKQKLSDSDYGGRFYDYAQSFFTQSGGLENVPTWVPAYVILISELGDLVLSDYQGVWYSTATKSLYDGAMVDFVRVLNGEDLGGGSGGVAITIPEGDYYKIPLRSDYGAVLPSQFVGKYAYISVDLMQDLYSFLSAPDYVSHGIRPYYCFRYDPYASDYVFFFLGSSSVRVSSQNSYSFHNMVHPAGFGNTFLLSDGYFLFRDEPLRSVYDWYFDGYYDVTNYVPLFMLSDNYSYPVVHWPTPDGQWPEPVPTPTPTAPDLPDPVEPTVTPDPVVTEPTPTWPDVNITVNPPAVIVPETPEGLDYTALLTLINDNLESIDSYTVAINSSLNSLRSDLVTQFDGVVQSLRNIYSYLQHMDSVLERHCVHLQNKMEDVSVDIQNKMRELVHWLAEQLDFDSESSGNSDLFGILSTINDKLGGGTYEPNPIRDEQGYYEWLDNLWDKFLLGDNWQSSASSMSQSFGQLTSRFPFSVPWDIVALFRLFVHDPVTPVFDLPLYYSSDDSATVRVDLSAWDGVASVVRPLVFVIFALKLALLSRHLLAGFGADKGGL